MRHSDQKNQPGAPVFSKRDPRVAAPDSEHDLIDQVGAQMCKRDLALDRAGVDFLARQQLFEKFFGVVDFAICAEHLNELAQGADLGGRPQLQGNLLFVEEIGWSDGHRI